MIPNKELTIRIPVFQFELIVEAKVSEPQKIIMWITDVKIKIDEQTTALAKFTVACIFEFLELNKLVSKNENGQYVVPVELDNLLNPIAVSTTPGFIYSELRGTYLNAAIMPVIFMDTFKPTEAKIDVVN
jgi:hypothetical protein